jgi:F0F1-type ATP synthase membrane subunit b/b'
MSSILALVTGFIFLLAESSSGSSTSAWESFRELWDTYVNYPGFELWKFFNLAIFIALLVYFLKKPVGEAFKAKREVIRAELIKAEEEKQAALTDLTTVEAKLVGVDQEKDAIMKSAREEIDFEKKRLAAQAEFEANKLAAQADGEVKRLGQVARLQLRRFAVDESLRMAEEKLRTQVDDKADTKLVKTGIEAIGGLN